MHCCEWMFCTYIKTALMGANTPWLSRSLVMDDRTLSYRDNVFLNVVSCCAQNKPVSTNYWLRTPSVHLRRYTDDIGNKKVLHTGLHEMWLHTGGTLPWATLTQYIHNGCVSHYSFILYHGCMLIMICMVHLSYFFANFFCGFDFFEAVFMSISLEIATQM